MQTLFKKIVFEKTNIDFYIKKIDIRESHEKKESSNKKSIHVSCHTNKIDLVISVETYNHKSRRFNPSRILKSEFYISKFSTFGINVI